MRITAGHKKPIWQFDKKYNVCIDKQISYGKTINLYSSINYTYPEYKEQVINYSHTN